MDDTTHAGLMTEEQRKEAWLADRRKHVTATDVAAILGLPGFTSRMGVYLDKLGLSDHTETERMVWGNRLQPAILRGYADRVQQPIEMADPYTLVECPDLPVLGASLDARWAAGDLRPVDAKNVAYRALDKWGDEGSDQIPETYIVQLTVQMCVTKTEVADLAVLFGGNTMFVYRVALDRELQARIYESVDSFWKTHIVGGIEPAVDGSAEWSGYLAKRVKQNTEVIVQADADATAAMMKLRVARDVLAEAEKMEAEASNVLKKMIGENAGISGPLGRVMWKATQGKTSVDWEQVAQSVARAAGMTDEEVVRFAAAHTKRGAGSRRFVPTFSKEE